VKISPEHKEFLNNLDKKNAIVYASGDTYKRLKKDKKCLKLKFKLKRCKSNSKTFGSKFTTPVIEDEKLFKSQLLESRTKRIKIMQNKGKIYRLGVKIKEFGERKRIWILIIFGIWLRKKGEN
jgi:hypothetical protein